MNNFNFRNPPQSDNFEELLRFAWDHGCGNRLTKAGDPLPWTYETLEEAFDSFGHSVDQRTIQNWLSGKNLPSRRNIYILTRILSRGNNDLKRQWMDALIQGRQAARKKKAASRKSKPKQTDQLNNKLAPQNAGQALGSQKIVVQSPIKMFKPLAWLAGVLLLSLFAARLFISKPEPQPIAPITLAKSIAVLPFEDLTPDDADHFFANGISEDIISGLTQIADLSVRSRTAAFRHKNSYLSLKNIAEELDVNYLLEGSFRKTGQTFRLTARLIRVHDGELLWADSYTDDLDEIFLTQENIAQSITTALDIYIDDNKRGTMFNFGTRNVEAYQSYLKGRALLKNWHETSKGDDVWRALAAFQAATKADPSMAKAYFHSVDPYFHFAKGEISLPPEGLGIDMPIYPNTVQDTITRLLEKAQTHAATPTDAAQYEVNKIIFSKDWTGLREAAVKFGNFAVQQKGELEWEFGPVALLITGEDDVLQRLVEDRILKFDPNNGTGHSYAIRSHLLKSNLAKAESRLGSANATTFSRRLEEVEAYLHFKNQDAQALEAHLESAKSLTESRTDYFLALAHILKGQNDLAIKLLTKSDALQKDQPQLALALMHAGAQDGSEELINQLNEDWFGPLNFTTALAYGAGCGVSPIRIMPELKQRFIEANIEDIPCATLAK